MKTISLYELIKECDDWHYGKHIPLPPMYVDELINCRYKREVYINNEYIIYRDVDNQLYIEDYDDFSDRVMNILNKEYVNKKEAYFDEDIDYIDIDKLRLCAYNSNYIMKDIVENYYNYYLML